MGDAVVELPDSLREELKEPLGPLYTDAGTLLADAGEPIVAVGDVVTHHLLQANHRPSVALIDGRTEREAVDEELLSVAGSFERRIEAPNPPGTLTTELLEALAEAISAPVPTVIVVDGEEDLALGCRLRAAGCRDGARVGRRRDEGPVSVAARTDGRRGDAAPGTPRP